MLPPSSSHRRRRPNKLCRASNPSESKAARPLADKVWSGVVCQDADVPYDTEGSLAVGSGASPAPVQGYNKLPFEHFLLSHACDYETSFLVLMISCSRLPSSIA